MRGKFASWQQTLQLPRGMGLKMPAHEGRVLYPNFGPPISNLEGDLVSF